jgi:hypothetical protein
MPELVAARSLDELLERSAASARFKEAVRALAAGRRQEAIAGNHGAPPVKLLRVALKLLETRPDLAIERLQVEGLSGCSDFIGTAHVEPGPVRVAFEWDCRWRAEQLGWRDALGDPDQLRAARELGYQCFRHFDLQGPAAAAAHGA